RHTRSKRDWSSDVRSSDLSGPSAEERCGRGLLHDNHSHQGAGGAQLRHPCYAARGGHRHSAGVAMLDQFPTHPSPGDPRGQGPASRLDNVIALAKKRGFVFPSGEIYGGTRSAWDYGPLGVEIKENIKKQW